MLSLKHKLGGRLYRCNPPPTVGAPTAVQMLGKFFIHPLRELEPEKVRQIKASYDDEIAALETEQGVWHEELIYYVVARKP